MSRLNILISGRRKVKERVFLLQTCLEKSQAPCASHFKKGEQKRAKALTEDHLFHVGINVPNLGKTASQPLNEEPHMLFYALFY